MSSRLHFVWTSVYPMALITTECITPTLHRLSLLSLLSNASATTSMSGQRRLQLQLIIKPGPIGEERRVPENFIFVRSTFMYYPQLVNLRRGGRRSHRHLLVISFPTSAQLVAFIMIRVHCGSEDRIKKIIVQGPSSKPSDRIGARRAKMTG